MVQGTTQVDDGSPIYGCPAHYKGEFVMIVAISIEHETTTIRYPNGWIRVLTKAEAQEISHE